MIYHLHALLCSVVFTILLFECPGPVLSQTNPAGEILYSSLVPHVTPSITFSTVYSIISTLKYKPVTPPIFFLIYITLSSYYYFLNGFCLNFCLLQFENILKYTKKLKNTLTIKSRFKVDRSHAK